MQRITQQELKRILRYDPETGYFYSLIKRGNLDIGDEITGSFDNDGYLVGKIFRVNYKFHRLAWFYMTGEWPDKIDHKDTIKHHNFWSNLRNADSSENSCNTNLNRRNTTGVKGLSLVYDRQQNISHYLARVMKNSKQIKKRFELTEKEEAEKWLKNVRSELHGDFRNDG